MKLLGEIRDKNYKLLDQQSEEYRVRDRLYVADLVKYQTINREALEKQQKWHGEQLKQIRADMTLID